MRKSDELSDPSSCLNKAAEDEILFVLMERDPAAPGTIRDWVARRIEMGLNKPGDPKLISAEQIARAIETGQFSRTPP
jgi:hypothetical protein